MSITRSLRFVALPVAMMSKFSPVTGAANYWNGNPSGLDFGTVTPGQTETTTTRPSSICNNYDGQVEYIHACLKVMTNDPLAVSQNEPSSTPLYFSVCSIYNQHSPLNQSNNMYAQVDFALPTGGTAEHDIPLIGKINPGQANVSAGIYYDYATVVQITYTSASSLRALPARDALNGTTITDQINASTTVKNDCEVISVDDMAFGSRSSAQSNLLQATFTANIIVQCSIGTDYSISIGHGLHPKGNQRPMCHNSECMNYTLYQDAAHSMEWTQGDPEEQYSADRRAQSLVAYGSVPAQRWPSPGGYTDTVVTTLAY